MAKRKIKCKKDKVPCRSLCEKLPRDLFSDTEYVWWHDTARHKWYITSRLLLEKGWGWKPSACIPAPTVDEIMDKMTNFGEALLTDRLLDGRWAVMYSPDIRSYSCAAESKRPVSAVCDCYLQHIREQQNRRKRCTK